MSETQTVIVYRSLTEQRMDQAMQSGDIFPIMVGLVAFFMTFVFLNVLVGFVTFNRKPVRNHFNRRGQKFNPQFVYLAVAGVVGCFVTWSMWL